jgi:hypothetical protein
MDVAMNVLDFYFMRVSAFHQELAFVAERMDRQATQGRGNINDPVFKLLEDRRQALNKEHQNQRDKIEQG